MEATNEQQNTIPLQVLAPEQSQPGGEIQVTAKGRIIGVNGEMAVVRWEAVNGIRLDEASSESAGALDEAAMLRMAAAQDEETWPD